MCADDLEAKLLKKATLEKVAPAPVTTQAAEKPKPSGPSFSFFGGGAKEAPKPVAPVAVTKAAAPAKATTVKAAAPAKAKTVAVTKETAKAVAPKVVAAAPKPGRCTYISCRSPFESDLPSPRVTTR